METPKYKVGDIVTIRKKYHKGLKKEEEILSNKIKIVKILKQK